VTWAISLGGVLVSGVAYRAVGRGGLGWGGAR
jgi:hypothetical protein